MRLGVVLALALLAPGCLQLAASGPCVRVSLYPESVTLTAGNRATFEVRAQNCGDVALTLGDGGRCDVGNGLNLTFDAEGMTYRLGASGGAVPANRTDPHVCGDVAAAPRTLQPGESATSSLAWNGTLMESTCFATDCVERYHDAPPGTYTLVARVEPAQGGAAQATLLARIAPRFHA